MIVGGALNSIISFPESMLLFAELLLAEVMITLTTISYHFDSITGISVGWCDNHQSVVSSEIESILNCVWSGHFVLISG